MCGIFGYVGTRSCGKLVLDGLKALEYRGYDSAGIATVSNKGKLSFIKKKGKVGALNKFLKDIPIENATGLGHTRWATHGPANDLNAHPHVGENFTIVHNGIIDNYLDIKNNLASNNVSFSTDTDTEVILKLFQKIYKKNGSIEESIREITKNLKGSFGLGLLSPNDPDTLYIIRKKSPLIIGKGKNENFFASDLTALAPHTNDFLFLEDNQYAKISKNSVDIKDFESNVIHLNSVRLANIALSKNSKGSYKHYMLKEIHDQKEIISSHIEKFYDTENSTIRELGSGLSSLDISNINHVILLGCGSAYYAACVSQNTLEDHFKAPVSVFLASEFVHKKTPIGKNTLILAISQSGETADTLASAEKAKDLGCPVIAICNTPYSSLTRLANFTMYIQAGTEIGVAATKTFTATLLSLMTLSYSFSKKLGHLKDEELNTLMESLKELPSAFNEILGKTNDYERIAKSYSHFSNFLFMGRASLYPIAAEGALKLKEISYCHAEGYAGGELKHGPISLVTERLPIVALCPENSSYKKMFSNMEEVAARKGRIIAVGEQDNKDLLGLCEEILHSPEVKEPLIQALLSNIPLQFFAYYVALDLKRNIDQPRNLAKSVTVE